MNDSRYHTVVVERLRVITRSIRLSTKEMDCVDITDEAQSLTRDSGLEDGVVTIFVSGSTGAITTMEYEPGLLHDLRAALDRQVPREIGYEHNARWRDGNGHSHIRASLLGPSLTVPFSEGKLMLGQWQQIIFVELDVRSRSREIVLQIIGE